MLSFLPFWKARLQVPSEGSRLILGSTGSGKSEGALVDLLRIGSSTQSAIVLLDPHGPLAQRTTQAWLDAGFQDRVIYEPIHRTDRTLSWSMLSRSLNSDPSQKRIEDTETRDDLVHCFLAPRGLDSLANRPYTKEWLEAALDLVLSQPKEESLSVLPSLFQLGSPDLERLLKHSDRPELVSKFESLEALGRRNPTQYQIQTGASRRLLEQLCHSEVIRLRSRPSSFDWSQALSRGCLMVWDGGGIRSRELKRGLFLLVSLQVIQCIRRQFATSEKPLPVTLVLEEAGAFDLVSPFILLALQELRKAGLSIHLISQSAADFYGVGVLDRILANTPIQIWYQVLSPSDQALGASVLLNASFESHAIHFERPRTLRLGRSKDRLVQDAFFKNPQLQEQEARSRLAQLQLGERLVRTRREFWFETVKPHRKPFDSARFTDQIHLLRQANIYQKTTPEIQKPLLASEKLRSWNRNRNIPSEEER